MSERQKVLVLPNFQYKLILAATIPFLIVAIFFTFQVYFAFVDLHQAVLKMNNNPELKNILLGHQESLIQTLWVSGIVATILMITALLVISHSLAGPLRRLQLHLREMRLTAIARPIYFRKNDYLKRIESDLNHCIISNFEPEYEDNTEKKSA